MADLFCPLFVTHRPPETTAMTKLVPQNGVRQCLPDTLPDPFHWSGIKPNVRAYIKCFEHLASITLHRIRGLLRRNDTKAITLHRSREPPHLFVEMGQKHVELVRPCASVLGFEGVEVHRGERVDPG